MDNVYLVAGAVALMFGGWIAHSGFRRWQQRHQPTTPAIDAQTSPLTDFRWRPQLEAGVGLLMILWALRIFVLFAMQELSAKPELFRENPVSGRVETLPTSAAGVEATKTR